VTYKETTMPVIEHFNKEGKVAEVYNHVYVQCRKLTKGIQIDSSPAVDEVYAKTQEAVRKLYANQADHTATATV
jgi:UMP-CMP kinase